MNASVLVAPRTSGELDRAARELFGAEFGGAPSGTWLAPGRANLIGDHVDYAGGVCLPFALELATVVAARRRADRVVRIVSIAPSGERWEASVQLDALTGVGELPDFRGYVAGTIWALGAGGLDVAVVSDVPVGSGLSSSAAVECAVAVAARDVFALGLSDDAVVAAAMRAENDVVGASTGGLDQRASVSGAPGSAVAIDFLSGTHRLVPCRFEGLSFAVINTRAKHSNIDGGYGTRRGLIDAASQALGSAAAFREPAAVDDAVAWARRAGRDPEVVRRRVRHVVTEITRTQAAIEALEDADAVAFGELMDASHDSLRDDFEVVTPELEVAVQAARCAGAVGARMTGGGFGGSIVALCADPEAVAGAVTEAAEAHGFPRPQAFCCLPQAGARRIG